MDTVLFHNSNSAEQKTPPNTTPESFDKQVDKAIQGKLDRYNALFVCHTPQLLLDLGFKQLPMLYTKKHLKNAIAPKSSKNVHKHGLAVRQIKRLPDMLKEPVMVFRSKTEKDSIVAVTNELNRNKAPVVIAVKMNGKGVYNNKEQPSNFVTSVYGKNNNFLSFILDAFDTKKMLYVDIAKSQRLLSVLRLQLPQGFNNVDFKKIIAHLNSFVNPPIQKNPQEVKKDMNSDLPNNEKQSVSKKTLVINAFGGPGAGKTTACLHIASELKKRGFVAEYVPEYAKELVWDKNFKMLDGSEEHQKMILAEQKKRLDRLIGQVDFIVTDAPVLLNSVYLDSDNKESYDKALVELFNKYDNFNLEIVRDVGSFEQEGRIHNLEQSQQADNDIRKLLNENGIYYGTYSHSSLDKIADNAIVTHNKLADKTISVPEIPQRLSSADNQLNNAELLHKLSEQLTQNNDLVTQLLMEVSTLREQQKMFSVHLNQIYNSKSIEETLGIMGNMGKSDLNAEECSVYSYDRLENKLFTVNGDGERVYTDISEQTAIGAALMKNEVFLENQYNGTMLGDGKDNENTRNVAVIPIEAKSGDVIGVVVAKNKDSDFTKEDIGKFDLENGNIGSAFRMGLENKALQQAAVTDKLTHLHNRQGAQAFLKNTVLQNIHEGKPVSAIMIDIDKFKNFNDTYGHDVGDKVLKQVADILKENVRSGDGVFRWGGEEMVIIANMDGTEAYSLAERLRQSIQNTPLDIGDGHQVQITASMGVAQVVTDTPERLNGDNIMQYFESKPLKRADERLYEAKENGRNCVVASAAVMQKAARSEHSEDRRKSSILSGIKDIKKAETSKPPKEKPPKSKEDYLE